MDNGIEVSMYGDLTVGHLREAIKDVPDEMEVVIELFGNQHAPSGFGVAKRKDDQMYYFIDEENEKPKFLPGRMITEGFTTGFCKKCGSTIKRNWYFKNIGCIQPECKNYYKRKRKECVINDDINFLIQGL